MLRPVRIVSRLLLLSVWLGALVVTGCDEAPTAVLLDVDSVGPARIDPGHRLVVRGAGFAVGHDVRVAMIGVLSRPFEPDEPIDESFAGEAVSESQVEVLVTETLLRERFGRSTFHGLVEVRFEASWDGRSGTITGALDDQSIDFVPARGTSARGHLLDRALGVAFEDVSEEGLEIASVEPGGRGSVLGLSPGDQLVAIGQARLVPGDAPVVPDAADATTLTILREGRTTLLSLDVGERASEEARTSELIRLAQLALLIVWASLLGAWPFSTADMAAPRPAHGLSRPTLAIVARALAGLLLAHLLLLSIGSLPSIGLVIAALVGVRAATTLAGSPRPMAQLLAIVVSSLVLAVALGALPAVLDSSDLALLARDGATSPLEWPFFREPVGVLSLVLLALAVGLAGPTRPVARAADDAWLLAVAALAVISGTGLSCRDRPGALAMDVAVVLVAWLLGRAREHVRPTAMTLGLAVGLSVGLVVLASAWVVADPTAQLRGALSEVSLLGVALTVVFALRAAVRERPAPRPQHALL